MAGAADISDRGHSVESDAIETHGSFEGINPPSPPRISSCRDETDRVFCAPGRQILISKYEARKWEVKK